MRTHFRSLSSETFPGLVGFQILNKIHIHIVITNTNTVLSIHVYIVKTSIECAYASSSTILAKGKIGNAS